MKSSPGWICYSWIYCSVFLSTSILASVEREPIIHRSPSNVSAIVDRNLTLTCEVEGLPTPNVFWQKRENSTGRWQQIVRGAHSGRFRMKQGILFVRRLLIGDTGYYRCSAENTKGSEYSAPAYLSVQAPVTFVSRPKNYTVAWGTGLELQCEVIGIPFPERWWAKNGQPIFYDHAKQLVFSDPRLPINATETAKYECLAKNSHIEGFTNVSQADFVTVIDGFCGDYNAQVCKEFLDTQSVYLKRSDRNVISRKELLSQELLEEFKKLGNQSCVSQAHPIICHYNFPLCVPEKRDEKKEAKPKNLCRETCVAVRDLFCQEEWKIVGEKFGESLPDCDRLPSRRNTSTHCVYVDLFNITEDHITTSCFRGDGSYYRGPVNITEGGLVCQAWSRQVPNRHNRFPSVYPILDDSGNACRNAGGERERPWCYTLNSSMSWQFCNVSHCDVLVTTQNSAVHLVSAFNIETAFIVATVTAIPVTIFVLLAVVCLRCVLPAFRKPQKTRSSDIDLSGLIHIPKPESDYPFPALRHLECQRNSIAYQSDIGEGAFGNFFLAEVPNIVEGQESTSVVVKMLQDKATPDMEQDFIREVVILSQFHHPNILQILGVCLIGRPWCILLEYMLHGDLNEFLQCCNRQHFIIRRRSRDSFRGDVPVLTCHEQLRIARQIAAGMLYVVQMGYIHRDLATRNCLVGNQMTVKISDFGLAVLLRPGEDYYLGGEFEPIPIRWSPLESIVQNQFTHASDVWSFGIVLWEIFSFGLRPYYNMTQEEVVSYVRQGKILSCPDSTPSGVYELMQICWNQEPANRPGFDVLHQTLITLENAEV